MPDRVGIENRPAIVDRKTRIGDWEADTIVGKNQKSALLTLVERVTRYTIICKLKNLKAEDTARAAIRVLKAYKARVHTITMDNGKEFYQHTKIAKALKAKTYFCRPYHSWEKGLNENTNGLIRQYFPKQTDFRNISDREIRRVQDELNHRPRKTLGYETPSVLNVEISSVVYSISRRILKHEHAQKHPPHPAPPTSHLAGLHAGKGKRHLSGTPLPSQPRHHLPRP